MDQQELDDVRFKLNEWETRPQIEIDLVSYARHPETGKMTAAIILLLDDPIMILPGMKIVVVPE